MMFSCLNFASAKMMGSGNLGHSRRALFPSKVWDAIKHHYMDSRNAWEVSCGKALGHLKTKVNDVGHIQKDS
jgi:hypothetical protein